MMFVLFMKIVLHLATLYTIWVPPPNYVEYTVVS
jgi:hypothetical protein